MDDMVAYVFDKSEDSDEPYMMFLVRKNKITVHAPKGSNVSPMVANMNKNLADVDQEDVQETFYDLVARYDSVASLTQEAKYVGAEMRRAEMLLRKWSSG